MDAVGEEDRPQLLDVCCNHCGAPLSLGGDTRFATCAHCGSKLEIRHSGRAAYSQVMQDIDQRTQRIERDVADIKSAERLAQLDREWTIRQQQFFTRDKDGNASAPTATGAIIGGVIMTAFGIFWTVMVASHNGPPFFILFGVVFVLIGFFGSINRLNQSKRYEEAERNYRRQRRDLSRRSEE